MVYGVWWECPYSCVIAEPCFSIGKVFIMTLAIAVIVSVIRIAWYVWKDRD